MFDLFRRPPNAICGSSWLKSQHEASEPFPSSAGAVWLFPPSWRRCQNDQKAELQFNSVQQDVLCAKNPRFEWFLEIWNLWSIPISFISILAILILEVGMWSSIIPQLRILALFPSVPFPHDTVMTVMTSLWHRDTALWRCDGGTDGAPPNRDSTSTWGHLTASAGSPANLLVETLPDVTKETTWSGRNDVFSFLFRFVLCFVWCRMAT